MINWNLMEEVPKVTADFKQRRAYFVFTGHGKINEPLQFFIDIQVRCYMMIFRMKFFSTDSISRKRRIQLTWLALKLPLLDIITMVM